MAASAIGMHFGIDPGYQNRYRKLQAFNLRSQLIRSGRNTIILDAYSASPSSMRASIEQFCEICPEGIKWSFWRNARTWHRKCCSSWRDRRLTRQGNFDRIFLIGNNFEHCADKCNFITGLKDTESFMEYLKSHPLNDSFIFIKGSRG